MKVKHLLGPAVLSIALFAAAPSLAASTDGAPMVTGKQWTESDDSLKKAYLLGMANLLQVERAYQQHKKERGPSDKQSLVPRIAKGLQNETLDSVRVTLDNWYAANPSRLDRPVVETLWYEIVVPGTKQAR